MYYALIYIVLFFVKPFPQRKPALYYRREPLKYGLQESPSSEILSTLAQGRVSQCALRAHETSPIIRHATCYDKGNTGPMQKMKMNFMLGLQTKRTRVRRRSRGYQLMSSNFLPWSILAWEAHNPVPEHRQGAEATPQKHVANDWRCVMGSQSTLRNTSLSQGR